MQEVCPPFRLMIFERHANLKYKYGSRNFWCRGYYADTVGRDKKIITEYVQNQLEKDYAADQISITNMQTRLRVTRIRRHKKTAA